MTAWWCGDDDDRLPGVDEPVEQAEQLLDVGEVEAGDFGISTCSEGARSRHAGAPRPDRSSRLGRGASDQLSPQLTAFFTSAAIFAPSAAVNSFSAKEVGHMAPWSRFAASSKPNVAYLELNFPALLKKQTTLPSLA